jgi:hypothetical protein
MMLIAKTCSLTRARFLGVALAASSAFGAAAMLADALEPPTSSKPSSAAASFAGTWHWMFDGKSFATMVLLRTGSGFTGTVTPSRIKLNDEGGLLRAAPGEDATPKPIDTATLEGSALRIKVSDGFQFIVTLKDAAHAEIHPVGAPPNMKPIRAEKSR